MSFQSVREIPTDFKIPISYLKNRYRLVTLANKVPVLLVCDPTVDVALVAVCLALGSYNDGNAPGLAHLAEHMAYLGLKQFPTPGGFQVNLRAHGGSSNAYTTGEQTTWYFKLTITEAEIEDEPAFAYFCRYFASLFSHPILAELAMPKEIAAIDDEHTHNTSDGDRELHHAMRLLARNTHPFHQFSTGDSVTLKGITGLKQQLHDYVTQHFVAEKFTIVVKGPQLLNMLQKFAVSFGAIRLGSSPSSEGEMAGNRNSWRLLGGLDRSRRNLRVIILFSSPTIPMAIIPHYYPEISEVFTTKKLLHISLDVSEYLRVFFPLKMSSTPMLEFYLQGWCQLLGDELQGLLTAFLRHKQFCQNVFVFTNRISYYNTALVLDFELMRRGSRHLDEVIGIIYSYIQRFTWVPSPAISDYLRDVHTLDRMSFHFTPIATDDLDEIAHLAQAMQGDMQRLGVDNLIRGYDSVAADVFANPQLCLLLVANFAATLKQWLNQDNSCIIYRGQHLTRMSLFIGLEISAYDRPYLMNYSVYTLTDLPQVWLDPMLEVPAANPYIIPEFMQIDYDVTVSQFTGTFQTKALDPSEPPQLVEFSRHHEIWWHQAPMQDTTTLSFSIQMPWLWIDEAPGAGAACQVLAHIAGAAMKTRLYPAERLGYEWGVYANWNDIPLLGVHVSGLSIGMEAVMTAIIEILHLVLTREVGDSEFEAARRGYLHELRQFESKVGIEQVMVGSLEVLEDRCHLYQRRLREANTLTLSQLQSHRLQLAEKVNYGRIFVTSNGDIGWPAHLATIANIITHHSIDLGGNPMEGELLSLLLAEGSHYEYHQSSLNRLDPMTTAMYYIQCGERHDPYTRTMSELMAWYIGIYAKEELRQKRGLGYHVMCKQRVLRGAVGIAIYVSGTRYSADELVNNIEWFLADVEASVLKMLDTRFHEEICDRFEDNRQPDVVSTLVYRNPIAGSVATDSSEVTLTHWNHFEQIYNHEYVFPPGSLGLIPRMSQHTFVKYFQRVISAKSKTRRVLSVCLSPGLDEEDRVQLIRDKLTPMVGAYKRLTPEVIEEIATTSPTLDLALETVMLRIHGKTKISLLKTVKKITQGSPPKPAKLISVKQVVSGPEAVPSVPVNVWGSESVYLRLCFVANRT